MAAFYLSKEANRFQQIITVIWFSQTFKQHSDSLGVVVHGVIAHEQRGVEGLGQQGVDGDHHQQHGQLQHRVQPQEDGARDHRQHACEYKILENIQSCG